jgi:uncharacterized protein YidB (DUF937 family)
MNKHQPSRRQFNALAAAVGLSRPTAGAMIEVLPAASVVAADAPPRTAKLRNSAVVPAIGQGSARLGQGRHPEAAEEEALRTGISLGMSLIDTSGNYGNGRSEKLIGRAIAGIGSGPNKAISPDDLANALGADRINDLMSYSGMSREDLLNGLSRQLPNAVDKLTPDDVCRPNRKLTARSEPRKPSAMGQRPCERVGIC